MPAAPQRATLTCSFCLRPDSAVAKLIAGPGVYICDGCVDLCNSILEGESNAQFRDWSTSPDDEVPASLGETSAPVRQLERTLQERVSLLRARGVTWARIGEAMSISRQAAWERFSGDE